MLIKCIAGEKLVVGDTVYWKKRGILERLLHKHFIKYKAFKTIKEGNVQEIDEQRKK